MSVRVGLERPLWSRQRHPAASPVKKRCLGSGLGAALRWPLFTLRHSGERWRPCRGHIPRRQPAPWIHGSRTARAHGLQTARHRSSLPSIKRPAGAGVSSSPCLQRTPCQSLSPPVRSCPIPRCRPSSATPWTCCSAGIRLGRWSSLRRMRRRWTWSSPLPCAPPTMGNCGLGASSSCVGMRALRWARCLRERRGHAIPTMMESAFVPRPWRRPCSSRWWRM